MLKTTTRDNEIPKKQLCDIWCQIPYSMDNKIQKSIHDKRDTREIGKDHKMNK